MNSSEKGADDVFCPECGKKIGDADEFCAYCGCTIKAAGASAPGPASPPPVRPASTSGMAPGAPYSPPAAPESGAAEVKAPGNIKAIAGAVAGVAAAAVVLFGYPGLLRNKGAVSDSSSSAVTADGNRPAHGEGQAETVQNGGGDAPVQSEEGAVTTAPGEISAPEEQTAAGTTSEAATTTTEQTTTTTTTTTTITTTTTARSATQAPATTASENFDEQNAIYSEALAFSTYDRPAFEEFEWCFGQNGLVYEPSGSYELIKDPLGYTGGWKAMVIYNPSNYAGTFIRELDNVDIGVYGDTTIVTIDWYFMSVDSGEAYSEEDMADTNLFGNTKSGGLTASGDAELELNYLYKADGKEYALGTMTTSDGLPAYIALVRP